MKNLILMRYLIAAYFFISLNVLAGDVSKYACNMKDILTARAMVGMSMTVEVDEENQKARVYSLRVEVRGSSPVLYSELSLAGTYAGKTTRFASSPGADITPDIVFSRDFSLQGAVLALSKRDPKCQESFDIYMCSKL